MPYIYHTFCHQREAVEMPEYGRRRLQRFAAEDAGKRLTAAIAILDADRGRALVHGVFEEVSRTMLAIPLGERPESICSDAATRGTRWSSIRTIRKPFSNTISCGSSPSSGQCSERTAGPACARGDALAHNASAVPARTTDQIATNRGMRLVLLSRSADLQVRRHGRPEGLHYLAA
jgi:hypothetical protein